MLSILWNLKSTCFIKNYKNREYKNLKIVNNTNNIDMIPKNDKVENEL